MACYVEAIDLGVWRVTHDGMKPPKNLKKLTMSDEKEIHLNARAKNCLYEYISMEIFNQVFTSKTSNEIWLTLHDLHDGTCHTGFRGQTRVRLKCVLGSSLTHMMTHST
jgi:hypothetical protein